MGQPLASPCSCARSRSSRRLRTHGDHEVGGQHYFVGEGPGELRDYGDTDLAQYLHHQGVDRLAICYWSAVFGSGRVGSGITGVPDFDQQGK